METAASITALAMLLLVLCVAIACVFSCGSPGFGWSGGNPISLWNDLSEHRRKNDPFIRAVLKSMERLVERHAAVELTPLIPTLNTIAADSHHHRDLTRSAAMNVISSIRAVTREVGELPISVQSPEVSSNSLPLAAEEPVCAEKT